jgi:hypothetical protein
VNDINDSTGFSWQHDARRQSNGNLTLFDNGNFHDPQVSRAVEYELDTNAMTATKVWEYRSTPDIYGGFMGNAQRLPNGNTLIGWGGTNPTMHEVRQDGTIALELTLPPGVFSYRALRFPWSGTASVPYTWAGHLDRALRELTVNFTKFGDTNVDHYVVYGGESPNPSSPVDSATSGGVVMSGLEKGKTYYFRVTSVDDQSGETDFSNEIVYDYVNAAPSEVVLTQPADGVTLRSMTGRFEWTRAVDPDLDPVSYEVHFFGTGLDTTCGAEDSALVFGDQAFTPGTTYNWTVNSLDGEATTASADTFTFTTPGVPPSLALRQNYPNPFNPVTIIEYELPLAGPVSLKIFNIAGQEVVTLVNGPQAAGVRSVIWDGRDANGRAVSSGVYLYRLEAAGEAWSRKLAIIR